MTLRSRHSWSSIPRPPSERPVAPSLPFDITTQTLQKGFVILAIIFFTRVATVDMALWTNTRIVPRDSQLWAIQCTWSSYRNWICYKSWEDYL